MLELLGKGYVIEHCMAFFRTHEQELAYKTYITDGLKVLTEHSARQYGGSVLTRRFIEIIRPAPEEPTASDIKARFKRKLGGKHGQ